MNDKVKQESLTQRYQHLFVRSINLIVKPKKEWAAVLHEKNDSNAILSTFVLPYVFLATIITFVKYLVIYSNFEFGEAIKQSLAVFSSLFFTYIIGYQILIRALPGFLNEKISKLSLNRISASLIAYSSLCVFIYHVLILLMPELPILAVILLYSIYLIWIGVSEFDNFKQKDFKVVVTIIISGIVLIMPFFLSKVIVQMSAGI